MTQDYIAGRDLDVLIAERVMERSVAKPPGFKYPPYVPHYSTDIAAAWTVVERMVVGPWIFTGSMIGGDSVIAASATFSRTPLIDRLGEVTGFAPTMPLAICRAALKAVP
jgi:hypothetical protein